MDQIIIKNFVIFGYHGVLAEEKAMGQKFIIDVVLDLDLGDACAKDALNETINYAKLCHELLEVFNREKYDLIERAGQVLCDYILMTYPQVKKVDLTLKKPWAPILLPIEYPAIRLIRERHIAYIAVGSNLGDKHENIRQAFSQIEQSHHTKIVKKSLLIETEPVGYVEQDTFVNGVFKVSTLLSPLELVRWLLSIEADLKRERQVKWGPRTLDLDIIYYDDLISDDEEIILPHPRMHERAFVLRPLLQIAPNAVHPLYKKRTTELLEAL